ncbi:MAG: hypothetical protein HQ518_32135 [Rhodopirellula sp.]|nr:hypothetical protein [Rhodopirellula sp.]
MTRTFVACIAGMAFSLGTIQAQTSSTDSSLPKLQDSERASSQPVSATAGAKPEARDASVGGVTILRHSGRPAPRVATDDFYKAKGNGQSNSSRSVRAIGGAMIPPSTSPAAEGRAPVAGTLGVFTPLPARPTNQRESAASNTGPATSFRTTGSNALLPPPAATGAAQQDSVVDGIPDAVTINSRMEQIKGIPEIDDESRSSQLKAYSEALEALVAASQLSSKSVQFQQELESLPDRVAELKTALEQVADADEPQISKGMPLPEVDQILADYEARLTETQAERQKAAKLINEQERRLRAIPGLVDQTKQELTADTALINGDGTDGGTSLSEAAIVRLRARGRMLESRLEAMAVEQQLLKAGSELASLRRELAEKRENVAEKTTKLWRAAVADYRQSEADRKAREARELLASAHPALLEAAERNAKLAEERTQLTRKLEKLAKQQTFVDESIDTTNTAFEDVKTKYDVAGETTALGYLMRSYRQQLPDSESLREQQAASESEMSEVQLQLLLLKDERDALPAFEEQLDRLHSELLGEIPSDQRRVFDETVTSIRSDRREYLQALISDYENQVASLSNYNFAAGRLLESRDSFAEFIGEHVLWIRSAAPLTSRQELAGATGAIAYLLSPANFVNLVRQTGATSKTRPFEAAALLLAFAVALAYGRRFRKQLIESARLSSAQDSLRTALRAVGFSLIAASVWPLLIGMVAWRIGGFDNPTPWSAEFASALKSVAVLLLTAGVIRQLCREHGVGELIFGWSQRVTSAIRKSIASAVLLGCPLAFGVNFLAAHGDKVWIDSLGRTLFIGGMVLLSFIAHRVLHPRDGIFGTAEIGYLSTPIRRLPRIVYLFGLACPVALGVLAAAGYFFTAEHLSERLVQTLWLVTGIAIGVSLVRRWLAVIAEELDRRLHRRTEEEQLSGGAANSENPGTVETISLGDAATSQEQSAVDSDGASPHVTFTPLAASKTDTGETYSVMIRSQLSRLVNMAATVLLVVGCWSIWSSVLPALGVLDHIELGMTTVVAEKTVTAPDGSVSVKEVTEQQAVTLRHLLIGIGLVVITCIAARNLPGLLEAVLFDRLPLDAGGRYAATTLSRYGVTTVGWIWALSTVGVTWGVSFR